MPISFFICLDFMSLVGVIGILRFKQLSTPLRYIEGHIIYSVVSGWTEHVLGSYYHVNNLWLIHFNTLINLTLLLAALYCWRFSKWNGILLRWSLYSYIVIWIVGKFSFEPLSGLDVYSNTFAQLIQIIFSVWLMMTVLKDTRIVWKNDSRFWVASGVIIYVTSTFLLFGFFNVLLTWSPQMLKVIWHINWYAIILTFGFFLRSFFCKPERTSQDLVVGATDDLLVQ
ncbi:MAG: hypothetical protein NTX44_05760 [Ignavibacteriales bacterium]|nr:hypothetical protein [Ignavibacteriales bacterium]